MLKYLREMQEIANEIWDAGVLIVINNRPGKHFDPAFQTLVRILISARLKWFYTCKQILLHIFLRYIEPGST